MRSPNRLTHAVESLALCALKVSPMLSSSMMQFLISAANIYYIVTVEILSFPLIFSFFKFVSCCRAVTRLGRLAFGKLTQLIDKASRFLPLFETTYKKWLIASRDKLFREKSIFLRVVPVVSNRLVMKELKSDTIGSEKHSHILSSSSPVMVCIGKSLRQMLEIGMFDISRVRNADPLTFSISRSGVTSYNWF